MNGANDAVGVEINANHVRGAPVGSTVYAEGRPLKIGRSLQVGNQLSSHSTVGSGFEKVRLCGAVGEDLCGTV